MIKRGNVWWIQFDPAIGQEIKKIRPAVIVSNNRSNDFSARFQVVPLTTKTDRLYPGEALVTLQGKKQKAMANQIRTVSIKRLKYPIGILSAMDMHALNQALKIQLDLL